MTESIESIASSLLHGERNGYLAGRRALHRVLAEEVALSRVPAMPEDGMRSRAKFLEMWEGEASVFAESMDGFHQEDVDAVVDGDRITLRRALCGTAPDGTSIRVPIENVLTVADGKVAAIQVHLDPADVDRFRTIIVAGGRPHADFLPHPDR